MALPRPPRATPELEQYRTPPAIAAELLALARDDGAVEGRRVLDLGCGTGTFALGAALLGAQEAVGLDVDAESVALAREAALAMGVAGRVRFEVGDVAAWEPDGPFDAAVMNPPFGAQAANRHADRTFLEAAARAVRPSSGTVWFLALERTQPFLLAFARQLGGTLERVAAWDYPLEATMPFHAEGVRAVRVGGYRLALAAT